MQPRRRVKQELCTASISISQSHGGWRWTDSRPISSILLNGGAKELLLNETKDFLKSEKHSLRRGYLLHDVFGSRKSSVIHAVGGELELVIYTLSLSSSWISGGTLTTLMPRIPARYIVLLENLDAAFTRSITRDWDSTGTPGGDKTKDRDEDCNRPMASSSRSRRSRNVNTFSLSGLLNALDAPAFFLQRTRSHLVLIPTNSVGRSRYASVQALNSRVVAGGFFPPVCSSPRTGTTALPGPFAPVPSEPPATPPSHRRPHDQAAVQPDAHAPPQAAAAISTTDLAATKYAAVQAKVHEELGIVLAGKAPTLPMKPRTRS
ncbi:hypothetical protein FIBSPDRAFT_1050147 [Athelia psychrophila]|uniref:Uncharacterized protein n=1 Tax=Athelia psychrophila TaxID=1759441 RepID=A0A166B6N5_9AGAM|nr:hypothetical protein FIBSPDRAFT_1050147 [Fibularhizoctonia sp. CBS 109695]